MSTVGTQKMEDPCDEAIRSKNLSSMRQLERRNHDILRNARMITGNAMLQYDVVLWIIKVPLLDPSELVHLLHERALAQYGTD